MSGLEGFGGQHMIVDNIKAKDISLPKFGREELPFAEHDMFDVMSTLLQRKRQVEFGEFFSLPLWSVTLCCPSLMQ